MTTPSFELPKLLAAQLYAEQHHLVDDPLGQAVMHVLAHVADDAFCGQTLLARVHRHQIAQAMAGPYRTPHLTTGDIILGHDQHGQATRTALQTLNGHVLRVGGTGSGKTNSGLFHLLQVAPRVSGLWVFDVNKKEFRKLKALLARLGLQLLIVPVGALRLNLLQVPPDVAPGDWCTRIAELLVLVLDLPQRATKLLQVTLHRCYETRGVLAGGDSYPTLAELRQAVEANRQAHPQARDAVLDGLDTLLTALGRVLAYRRGWSARDLAPYHINFVLAGIPRAAQDLIVGALLLGAFTSRIAAGQSNTPLDLYVCVDEAQRLLTARHGAPNVLAELLPVVRGLGMGVDLSVPASHGLIPEVLSCTATKFLGRVGSPLDLDLMGRALGLNAEQQAWAVHHLRPGRFIAQVGDGDWRYPFVLEVPLLKLPVVSDPDAVDLGPLATLPVEPCDVQAPASPVLMPGTVGVDQTPSTSATVSAPTDWAPFVDEREYRFCAAVVAAPLLPSSQYAKRVGVSTQTAITLRASLVQKGLLIVRRLDRTGRGRPSLLLEPTSAGRAAVAAHAGGSSPC